MKLDLRTKRATRIAVVVAAAFLLPFIATAASATTILDLTLANGSTVCPTDLGGTWISPICIVTSLSLASSIQLTVDTGVILDNSGTLTNFGTIIVVGELFNGFAETVHNTGSIFNDHLVDTFGTINNAGGFFDTGGNLFNEGTATFSNSGTFVDQSGAGAVNNGTFDNNAGGSFEIDNFFANDNGGIFSNAATAVNFGTLFNGPFATSFTNSFGADLTNEPFAILTNDATISNPGLTVNLCHGIFTVGTVTGNPVQFHPCAPVISTSGTVFTRTPTISGTSDLASGGGAGSTTPMSINLFEGLANIGTTVTDTSGNWNIVTPSLASGDHTFTATAKDTGGHISLPSAPSTITVFLTTTLVASCTPTPFPVGTGTTCTSTVVEQPGSPSTAPTGSVTLTATKSGAATGPCALSPTGVAGQSQCQDVFTPAAGTEGSITITLSYGGDVGHGTSSSTFSVSATTLATTSALSCPAFVVNSPGACFGFVTDSPNTANIAPTGTDSFTHSSSGAFAPLSGMCTLVGLTPASARCFVIYTPSLGSEGTVTIGVSYGGDTDHATSGTSGIFSVSKRSDATAVLCVPSPDPVNEATLCTATVTDISASPGVTPTGTVSFTSSGAGLFSSTSCILSGGVCSVTFTPNPGTEGAQTIGASYGGDTDHLASAGSFGLTVIKRSTSTSVSCTGLLDVGSPETCTATINDITLGTPLTPTGTVTFKVHSPSGVVSTFTCKLIAGVLGTASCHISFSPGQVGTWKVAVLYPGDVNHLKSTKTVSLSIAD